MKTLVSIALAGAIAATGVVATASGASAGGGWHHRGGGPGPGAYGYYHRGPQPQQTYAAPDAGGALFAGAILGLTFGLIASDAFSTPPPPPQPMYVQPRPVYVQPQATYLPPPHPMARPIAQPAYDQYADDSAHYEWCAATYRSYNPNTDTYRDFRGVERQCVEPYQ